MALKMHLGAHTTANFCVGVAAIPRDLDADLGVGMDENLRPGGGPDLNSDRVITKSSRGRADQLEGRGCGVMKSRERPNSSVKGWADAADGIPGHGEMIHAER